MSAKDVIIYDAIDCGEDWQNDMIMKWKAQREIAEKRHGGDAEVLIIARENDSHRHLTFNENIVAMIDTPGALHFNVIKKSINHAITIGMYLYNSFKYRLFAPNSMVIINSCNDGVLTVAELASFMVSEYIKPEDHIRVDLGRITLHDSGNIFDTGYRTIIKPYPEES